MTTTDDPRRVDRDVHPVGDSGGRPAERSLGARPSLVSGRAVVGALLVIAAGLGAYLLAGDDGGPTDSMVVTSVAVHPGQHLDPASLRVEPVDLPAEVLAGGFDSIDGLGDAVALTALSPGDPIRRSAVATGPAARPATARQLSFAVEADRAVDGTLRPGEVVDLVGTFGQGADAYTAVVLHRAAVVDVGTTDDDAVGAGRAEVLVTLAVADDRAVLDASHALETAAVRLVRATGAEAAPVPEPVGAPPAPPTDHAAGGVSEGGSRP